MDNTEGAEQKAKTIWFDRMGLGLSYSGAVVTFDKDVNTDIGPDNKVNSFPNEISSISFHIPKTPIFLNFGIVGSKSLSYSRNLNDVFGNDIGGNLSIDFMLLSHFAAKWFELRLSLGTTTSIFSYDDGSLIGLSMGLRLPLGMSFWIGKKTKVVEIFLQALPTLGFGLGFDKPIKSWLHLDTPAELGVRFWF